MITLITSLYKSEKYIQKYAGNLKLFANYLQNKIDFEIIVIANDPTKKEREVCEQFKNKEWFKYLSVPRESLYATWNRAIKMAQGDIVGFWNVDDIRKPEAILAASKFFDNGAEVVYFPFLIKWYINIFRYSFLIKWKKIFPPVFDKKEFTRSMHCGPFFLFSKNLYNEIGPFDEQFKIVGDFDWCVRAAKNTDKFFLAKELAGIFRVDGGGLSSGGKLVHKVENNVVYKRHKIEDKIVENYNDSENKYFINKIKSSGEYIEYGS